MLFKRYGCCKRATSCLRMFTWYVARGHTRSLHLQRVRKFISRSLGMLRALNVCFPLKTVFRALSSAGLLWKTRILSLRNILSNYQRLFRAEVRFNNKKTKTTGRIFPGTSSLFLLPINFFTPRSPPRWAPIYNGGNWLFLNFPFCLLLKGADASHLLDSADGIFSEIGILARYFQ